MPVSSATMPRLGRVILPDQPLHIIQRGNDRQRVFLFHDDDHRLYRHWLTEAARECGKNRGQS
jgi:putative transposase